MSESPRPPIPRRARRLLGLLLAGSLLSGVAFWLRFAWAPRAIRSKASLSAEFARHASERALAGQFTQAAELYQRAVELEPRNLDAWLGLAAARADGEDRGGALAALADARKVFAPDLRAGTPPPALDLAQGRVHLRFREHDRARASAEAALRRSPNDPQGQAILMLARAESLASHDDEAALEALARRALAAGYMGPEPYYALGMVALRRGRSEAAIAAFRAALRRDPRSPALRYRLAGAYRQAGRLREAEAELREFERLRRGAR